ncbi:hypothetical protein MKX01_041691 [Papaver californicum]|nr:hypothetical protein MKX01_041691 [Papaver californicum]
MVMKKGNKVNVSGKPKHSLDVTIGMGKLVFSLLLRYNGSIFIGQKELQHYRDELRNKLLDPYKVILKERNLHPFKDAFEPQRERKRPKLLATGYESLLRQADGSQGAFEGKAAANPSVEGSGTDGLRDLVRHTMFEKGQSKRIWGELYKVIDSSDVVVQVLDARDPQGTRCYHLERHLKEHCRHKHMVFLLNKCDLVPANIPHWLFMLALINLSGKGSLLSVQRQFAGLKSDKQAISVGFVGYPNVGKSSVINTLRTKSVCKVAPIPGETKVWQYITLMKRVFLIDCPGVVYQNSDNETDIVLKGVVSATNLEDATEHRCNRSYWELLKHVKKDHLQRAYKIKDWVDPEDFLILLFRILAIGHPVLAVANVISFQQLKSASVPRNLFEQNELEAEYLELASAWRCTMN